MTNKTTPVHPLLLGTTPGPWKVTTSSDHQVTVVAPWSVDVKPGSAPGFGDYRGIHVCDIEHHIGHGAAPKKHALANAKLIAAAPFIAAENAALAEQVDRLRRALESVCDGVERACSDNVAGANMRLTVPSLRDLLTSLNPH